MVKSPTFSGLNSFSEFMELLKKRRTHRSYKNKKVSVKKLVRLIKAASLAPSAHNSQPWLFIALQNSRERVIHAMLEAWRKAMLEDERPIELIQSTIAKFERRFERAPVVLLCCVDHSALYYDRYKDEQRKKLEGVLGHHSVAAAIQNILLAAAFMGLGACWYSAPLFCQKAIRDALALGDKIEPVALLTLGYPLKQPKRKKLKPLKAIFKIL